MAETFFQDWFERGAVLFGLIYVVLAIKEKRSCWLAAILSSLLYIPVFIYARLYTEACLQFFFIAVSFYGWLHWRSEAGKLPATIHTVAAGTHVQIIGMTLLIGAALGVGLKLWSDASFPFIDSQITAFSIAGTYLQARKILENWIYWMVIDGVAVSLYIVKDLYPTAGLFLLYIILAGLGLRRWRAATR